MWTCDLGNTHRNSDECQCVKLPGGKVAYGAATLPVVQSDPED